MSEAALVVLSGGQDSAICLFWARQRFSSLGAISFDYGQRHRIELDCAKTLAELAGVCDHQIVCCPGLLEGTSPLIDAGAELAGYQDFASMQQQVGQQIEATFVPMRNALFLTIAANRAVCGGYSHVVIGVCQADTANYPDCRQPFIDSQEATIHQALGSGLLSLRAPLLHRDKAQALALAVTVPGAFEALAFTHTAYDGMFPPTGHDHASVLRAWGFQQADLPDPLVLRAWDQGLMALPDTPNYRQELLCWALEERQCLSRMPSPSLAPPPSTHRRGQADRARDPSGP